MNCPPAIEAIVLEILQNALLRARFAAWAGNSARAASEADHVHNLPDLLKDYCPAKLHFYWEISKPSFQAVCKAAGVGVQDLTPLWERLRKCIEERHELLSAR